MKIAISNIAWQLAEEEQIAKIMQSLEIKGVEIAPTKIWHLPLCATNEEIISYQKFWRSHDIAIVAMQALLYGRNDLTIFENSNQRQETFNYLAGLIELAAKLDVRVLVFGAPKNRKICNLTQAEALEIASLFFYKLGELAAKHNIYFCIEPNPSIYECDFVTNSQQGLELVSNTNSKGFGLHLDAAAMTLNQENISKSLKDCYNYLCHFHISEPYLQPITENKVNHQKFAQTLKDLNYQHWVSIEMKALNNDDNINHVTENLKQAIKYYR